MSRKSIFLNLRVLYNTGQYFFPKQDYFLQATKYAIPGAVCTCKLFPLNCNQVQP